MRFFRLYSRKPHARLSADADSPVSREKCGESPACLLVMDKILKAYYMLNTIMFIETDQPRDNDGKQQDKYSA